jgi:hexosaminidase
MNLVRIFGSMFFILTLMVVGVQADLNHLVPVPVTMTARTDTFTVPRQIAIYSDGTRSDSSVCWVTRLFDQLHVANAASYDTAVHVSVRSSAHVRLSIVTNATLGSEGYMLTITRDSILIAAQTTSGQFYAIQTIRQMLPPQIECAKNLPSPQKLPGCVITDYPRFAHRGTHFDIARHFYNITYLRQLIDRIALFKGNILHLHLTDDQGWRIVINPPAGANAATVTAYNNLTTVGGNNQVGGTCANCWFTQAQVRDSLVKYATERKLNIVPEIDMPGHTQAAIAAFAQAGITISSNCWNPCNAVYQGTNVKGSCLAISPITAVVDTFVRTVWTQMAAIFPSTYLHMGGDECPVSGNAYSNFVQRAEVIINNLGRRAMGWEDVYGYTQNANSITQTWNSGNDHPNSIFTWCNRLYYDQSEGPGTGYNNWCSSNIYLSVSYSALSNIANHFGVEGAMWTEMTTPANGLADRDIWPRQSACGELGWSSAATLNFNNFATRMQPFGCRYACMGIRHWYHDGEVTWQTCAADSSATPTNALSNYNWQLIPVTAITAVIASPKVPVASQFSALSDDGGYKVIDFRGRVLGMSSGRDLSTFNALRAAGGVYFVVNKKGNIVQKVLRK